jgi:small conductance mechanosensitive channel
MATTSQANETPAVDESNVSEAIQETLEIAEQVSEYGSLISSSLYLILGGMLVIFLLHKLASKVLYPYLKNRRLIKVVFGTLYVLILVIVTLMALRAVGLDVTLIGKIAILIVLTGAVIVFFLVPFFPRLPFKIGHMIESNGVLGFVDNISTFHTTIRKLDGTMAFVPNALVMATKILNYHDLSERRIEINISVNTDCNLRTAKALVLRIMNEDERVLESPALPKAFIVNATASGTDITAFCWVANADWFATRSDLWLNIVDAIAADDQVTMSLPQQEVYLLESE